MKVITRFAPSPTGYLHIGGVRTALFNYVFAKKYQGTFLVRIEDTDKERSKPEYIEAIMEGLHWLGLNSDQKPIKQSERFDVYKEEAFKLVKADKAYEDDGAIRLKINKDGSTLVKDLVYGDIEFPNKELDDLVILRSDESPTYHFCNVIDDNYQNVTHIIRGEDHLPNTPKQIQIVNALGYEGFEYVHLPLVLGEDRKRLSKRHAATDLMSYRQEGYLPEAVLNMLAKLGWSNTTEDIFDLEKLIEIFEVQDIQKAGAVFDIKKLDWINTNHLANLDLEEFIDHLKPYLKKESISLESKDNWKENVAVISYAGAAIAALHAGDLFTLFFWWEATAFTSVFLILGGNTTRAYRAAFRYIVIQVGSGMFLLAGAVLFLYSMETLY